MINHPFSLTYADAAHVRTMMEMGAYADPSEYVRDLIKRDREYWESGCRVQDTPARQIADRVMRQPPASNNAPQSSSDVPKVISASRLGRPEIQRVVLYERASPTVVQLHHMSMWMLFPKAMQIEADLDAEPIKLRDLAAKPGGVLISMGMSNLVHPLTNRGEVIGSLIAYEDAERVLRQQVCDLEDADG